LEQVRLSLRIRGFSAFFFNGRYLWSVRNIIYCLKLTYCMIYDTSVLAPIEVHTSYNNIGWKKFC
jgi:hypothetical protein